MSYIVLFGKHFEILSGFVLMPKRSYHLQTNIDNLQLCVSIQNFGCLVLGLHFHCLLCVYYNLCSWCRQCKLGVPCVISSYGFNTGQESREGSG